MRVVGIIAIFVLCLAVIAEGAFLVKLSRQVNTLSQQEAVARERGEPGDDSALAATERRAERAAPRLPRGAQPGGGVPSFQALAPPPTTPATTTLREALATSEGREQLKAAMEVIAEEKRQDRLVKWAARRDERDQHYKERILKAVPLTGDEPLKLATLFTNLKSARQQVIDDMRAGLKTAEQADEDTDELQANHERAMNALLGEERWKKARESRRERGQGPGQAPQAGQASTPNVAASR